MKKNSKRISARKAIKSPQQYNLPALNFNILISGKTTTPLSLECQTTITNLFTQIIDQIQPYRNPRYGFSETKCSYQILFSTESCNLPLEQYLPESYSFFNISSNEKIISSRSSSHSTISFNLPNENNADAKHELINWMMEQSDLFFTIWDGTKECESGAIWSLILQAHKKGIPILWMNPAHSNQLYVYQGGISTLYDENYLPKYLCELLGLNGSPDHLQELKTITNSSETHKTAWSNYYKHFINNFKVAQTPSTADTLLEEKTSLPDSFCSFEEKYNTLKTTYEKADQIAVIENNNYRSALLFRALLPFIANCVLIFGFYGYTIAGHYITLTDLTWNIIIAGSFFLQALCNGYIIWLSDLNNHKGWHKLFVDQRYIAEVMRLAIHFTPINLPLNIGSTSISSNSLPKDSPVSHFLRSILRTTSINCSVKFQKVEKEFFFTHTINLLSHQIDYHHYTASKHKLITKNLTRIAQVLFWLGITVIISRVALQFVFISFPQQFPFNTPERNLISAIANLLAMIVPSAAATVYTILNLCGFRDLGQRSQQMVENLSKLKELFVNESKKDEIAYDDYCRLAKQVSTLLLKEATDWYALINTKKITKN